MIPNTLHGQIADLYGRLAESERRSRNRKRTGTIAEVGTGDNAGKYRVKLGEQGGKPYLSGWMKPRTLGAGGVKIDVLLSEGEQVDVNSETGDLADGTIDLSTYSEANARENVDTPLHIKIGDTVIAAGGGAVTITATSIKMVGAVEFTGTVTSNGKDISSTHKHGGVVTGSAITATPV